jgi:hypothetical protein
VSHNKFGRRYNRHKTKHGEYFEAIAADVVREGPITVQFGELRYIVEVQKMSFDVGGLASASRVAETFEERTSRTTRIK